MSKSHDEGKNPTENSSESESERTVPTTFLAEQYSDADEFDVTVLNYLDADIVAEISVAMDFGEVSLAIDEETARMLIDEMRRAVATRKRLKE